MGVSYQGRRRILVSLPRLGLVTFDASTDHASVSYYSVRLYVRDTTGSATTSYNIGKPTPSSSSGITWHGYHWLNSQSAGDYEVRVAAIGSTGEPGSESTDSNAFTVPLTSA
jgi:hypothetical protein